MEATVTDYVDHLTKVLLYGPNDPLFPKTRVKQDEGRQFKAVGLDRAGWQNAGPIRAIFKRAFESAGLPYYNPHSFRDCLENIGEAICTTPEEFKAWSQNLGHDKVATTLRNYGAVTGARQSQVIADLGKRQLAKAANGDPSQEEIARVLAHLKRMAG